MKRTKDFIKITNLEIYAYHGVLEEEKQKGQVFFVNLKLYLPLRKAGLSDDLHDTINYDEVCSLVLNVFTKEVYDLIEKAAEKTVEALLLQFPALEAVELELRKPDAPITCAPEDVSINIYREWHEVYLSFGSNVGNTVLNIDEAIRRLGAHPAIRNIRRSKLIVTKPYGPVEQDDFVNGCLEMETYMDPETLLEFMHEIEDSFYRDRSIHWGPRPIDLDIVFFDDYVYNSKTLTIPHADMENRMFVLEPLSELCQGYRHPVFGKTVAQMKKELVEKGGELEIIRRI